VAGALQNLGDTLPAPATVPGTVNQNERGFHYMISQIKVKVTRANPVTSTW
jgi:hypothetical protein